MVTFRDGITEEYAYATAADANAFTHAVEGYHATGVGEDWYANIVRIIPRANMHMAN